MSQMSGQSLEVKTRGAAGLLDVQQFLSKKCQAYGGGTDFMSVMESVSSSDEAFSACLRGLNSYQPPSAKDDYASAKREAADFKGGEESSLPERRVRREDESPSETHETERSKEKDEPEKPESVEGESSEPVASEAVVAPPPADLEVESQIPDPPPAPPSADSAQECVVELPEQLSEPEPQASTDLPLQQSLAGESGNAVAEPQPQEAVKANEKPEVAAEQAANANVQSRSSARKGAADAASLNAAKPEDSAIETADTALSGSKGGDTASKQASDLKSASADAASAASSLEADTLIKIERAGIEKDSSSPAPQPSDSNPELIRILASRQSHYAMASSRLQSLAAEQYAASQGAAETESSSLKDIALAGAKNSLAQAGIAEASAKFAANSKGGHNDGATGNSWQGSEGFSKGQSAMAARQQAAPLAAHDTSKAVNAVQEIITRMQNAIRGESLDGLQKFSMDFQVGGLGQMRLALQVEGEAISVNLQTGNDSAKEQLMRQRDELEQSMKDIGFKDISLDISARGGEGESRERWRRHGGGMGNSESVENVKLSGDDRADLSQILAMSNN